MYYYETLDKLYLCASGVFKTGIFSITDLHKSSHGQVRCQRDTHGLHVPNKEILKWDKMVTIDNAKMFLEELQPNINRFARARKSYIVNDNV